MYAIRKITATIYIHALVHKHDRHDILHSGAVSVHYSQLHFPCGQFTHVLPGKRRRMTQPVHLSEDRDAPGCGFPLLYKTGRRLSLLLHTQLSLLSKVSMQGDFLHLPVYLYTRLKAPKKN